VSVGCRFFRTAIFSSCCRICTATAAVCTTAGDYSSSSTHLIPCTHTTDAKLRYKCMHYICRLWHPVSCVWWVSRIIQNIVSRLWSSLSR